MSGAIDIPSFADVLPADNRIKPYIHSTPALISSFIDGLAGAELFFTCKNFQQAGDFKARGASNDVFGVLPRTAPKLREDDIRGYGARAVEWEPRPRRAE